MANQNLTCDICGYTYDKHDVYAIVIECADGLCRCKVCRGAAKFNAPKRKKQQEEQEKEL